MSSSLKNVGTSISVVDIVATMMEEVMLIGCMFELRVLEIVGINNVTLLLLSEENSSKSTADGITYNAKVC